MRPSYRLQDRQAVVTGGKGAIGMAAVARLLAAGADVEVWEIGPATDGLLGMRQSANGRLTYAEVDVAGEEEVRAAAAALRRRARGLDILINCAGVAGQVGPVSTYSLTEWRRVFDTNMVGTFLCCRELLPLMLERDRGHIVNLASIAGKEGNPGDAAYSAAKAGVIAFTKALGKELALTRVRVNSIAPTLVDTPILKQQTPEHIARLLQKIPMARMAQADEVAAMIMWLTCDDCSFASGACFDCSGGRATY